MTVGKKVVCIDDSIKPGKEEFVKYAFPSWIRKDQIYTIRAIVENQGIVPGMLLKEVVNPSIYIHLVKAYQEPAFRLDRFRELEDSELEEDLVEELSLELEDYVY
jgi:hypothetical protein